MISLLFLAGCSSNSEQSVSVYEEQCDLLSKFEASLIKVSSIDGQGVDTVFVSADSINWAKEVTFLKELELLTEEHFTLDSSAAGITYIPKDNNANIKSATKNKKGKVVSYKMIFEKSSLIDSQNKELDIDFSDYGNGEEILSSYIIYSQSYNRVNSDSLTYKVEAQVQF